MRPPDRLNTNQMNEINKTHELTENTLGENVQKAIKAHVIPCQIGTLLTDTSEVPASQS